MSEVFEGVISKVSAATARSAVEDIGIPLSLDVSELPGQLSVIYRSDPRQSSAFSSEMERLAREISKRFSLALLVRYDSRIGHRSSSLYVDGNLRKRFGQNDKLFVPLDEDGEPLTTGPRAKFTELVDGEEYETIQNAIELGLAELGGVNWPDLKLLIGRI
jgi:hypothetical protein